MRSSQLSFQRSPFLSTPTLTAWYAPQLFADATVEQGQWLAMGLGSLAALLLVTWLARQIWVSFTAAKTGSRLVTEDDLRRRMRALKLNLTERIKQSQDKVELRLDTLATAQDEMSQRLTVMEKDTRERFHKISDQLQPLITNIAVIQRTQADVAAALKELSHDNKGQTEMLTEINTLIKAGKLVTEQKSQ